MRISRSKLTLITKKHHTQKRFVQIQYERERKTMSKKQA